MRKDGSKLRSFLGVPRPKPKPTRPAFKRDNKNRPSEATSKKPVGRFRNPEGLQPASFIDYRFAMGGAPPELYPSSDRLTAN